MQGVDSMILIAVDEKLQIIESKIVHFILGIGVIASSSFWLQPVKRAVIFL